MRPALQKIGDVEAPLFTPNLFDLIGPVLPVSQIIQHFPLAESLLVSRRCLLARQFKTDDLFSQAASQLTELLT